MTIRNEAAYMRNLWNWQCLDGCMGERKQCVSDVDGIVERNGQFLVIETKSTGVEVPMGQSIMFSSFTRLPEFRVLIVWGKPGHVTHMQRWGGSKREATNEDMKDAVKEWWKRVNKLPRLRG